MKKQRILILGGSGQIGSALVRVLSHTFELLTPSSKELDVTNILKAREFILSHKPDQIIYAVGYTKVDEALQETGSAFSLNSGSVLRLTYLAASLKIPFHYISTELVFNGEKKDCPYIEQDLPDPLLILGQTKQLGELATLNASQHNSVLRIIMCYSTYHPKKMDLARLAINKLKAGEAFTATNDQFINPIYDAHLARAVGEILAHRAAGIFHLGALDFTTPFEFVKKMAKVFNYDENLIRPVKFSDFSKIRPELRPQHQWLDPNKFINHFGDNILKSVDEGISDFAKNYSHLIK